MSLMEVEVPRKSADAGATTPERNGDPSTREVRHEYTPSLPTLRSQLGVSVLVSTYQADSRDGVTASASPGAIVKP